MGDITVRLRETGETVTIDEGFYNPDYHVREAAPTEPNPDTPEDPESPDTPDEFEAAELARQDAEREREEGGESEDDILAEYERKVQESADARVREALARRLRHERSDKRSREVAEASFQPTHDRARPVGIGSPLDPLYRKFRGTDVEKWRTEDNDKLCLGWFRALVEKDKATMRDYWVKLAQKYPMDTARYVQQHTEEGNKQPLENFLRTLVSQPIDPDSGHATGSAGALVPLPLVNAIELDRDRAAKIPQRGTQVAMSARTARYPKGTTWTFGMVGESADPAPGGTIPAGTDPVMSDVLLTARKAAGRRGISMESMEDAAFNIMNVLSTQAGRGIAALEDVQACTSPGTGNNITETFWANSTSVDQTGVGSELDYPMVVALRFAVDQQYRTGASAFWCNGTTMEWLSLILDANGRPIFSHTAERPGVAGDDGTAEEVTVLGRPAYEVPLADGELVYGDMRGYAWGRRRGVMLRTSEHVNWDDDVIDVKVTSRFDGVQIQSEHFVRYFGITAPVIT